MVVWLVGAKAPLRKEARLDAFHKEVGATPVVRLAYHYSCACLPWLLKKAEAPSLLLELYSASKEVLKLVPQLWDPPLVYPKQLLLLEHR